MKPTFITLLALSLCLSSTGAEKKPGTVLWAFETEGPIESSPAIGADGTVYVGTHRKEGGNKIYALDGKTRAKKWEFGIENGRAHESPAIGTDGTVYICSNEKKVYALEGKTGAKKWEFGIENGSVSTSLIIGDDSTLYFGSFDGVGSKVYALNEKTGSKKWELKTGDQGRSSPAMGSDGTLYIGSKDKKIYAIKTDSKGLAKSSWPMHGQNAQHTGRAPTSKK